MLWLCYSRCLAAYLTFTSIASLSLDKYGGYEIIARYPRTYFFYPAFTTLYEFEPPPSGGSEITHQDPPQSVGLLWTSDQPVTETSTRQYTQHSQRTTIHAPGGIRIRNPRKRLAVDTRLRPLGHWDRLRTY